MRRKRIIEEGAQYHITSRVNRQELALDSPKIKEMFLRVLCQAKNKFIFSISNIVLMGNHYHMIIKPGRNTSLSEIMKWIQQTMAIRYNRSFGLKGHFWGDRFYSRIIPDVVNFLKTFLYINDNPVRAGLTGSPQDWPWGFDVLKKRLGWLFDDPPPGVTI